MNEEHKKKLARLTSTWLITKLFGLIEKHKIPHLSPFIKGEGRGISPENFAEFITLIYQNQISGQAAMTVLEEMLLAGSDPSHIMEEKRLGKMDDEEKLAEIIQNIIKNNPKQVQDYKSGKVEVLQYFIGLTMKETEGRADVKVMRKILDKMLR